MLYDKIVGVDPTNGIKFWTEKGLAYRNLVRLLNKLNVMNNVRGRYYP